MITHVMQVIADDINGWSNRRRQLSEVSPKNLQALPDDLRTGYLANPVVLSNLVDLNGTIPVETEDRVVFTLVAVNQEKNVGGRGSAPGVNSGSQYLTRTQPAYLQLQVLFAARYKRYQTALTMLSDVIGYLQAKPVFTHENTPQLQLENHQINLNLFNLDFGQLGAIWNNLRTHYCPSVCYTIRFVPVGVEQVTAVSPLVEEAPDVNASQSPA